MANKIRDDIYARCQLLSNLVSHIESRLNMFPDGRIKIKTIHGNIYYYLAFNGKPDVCLKANDSELIGLLIQKSYLISVLRTSKKELKKLECCLKDYPDLSAEELYERLPEAKQKYTKSILLTDSEYVRKWMEIPFIPKGFMKGMPEYYTLNGERVRSKSEVIIADRLREKGVPYKYECPVRVGRFLFHPDFSVLRLSDRNVVYHEHCGKMDDPKYTEDLVKRINDYSKAGIVIGQNLFLTFESSTSPLDMKTLDELIENNFR